MVLVSGGFDPLHVGHLALFEDAAKYGPVVVALNSDAWLIRKKGFTFQPWTDRAQIIASLKNVSGVIPVNDADGTVTEAIERVKPKYFANGGDRTATNTPELEACRRLGVQPLFAIGGDKANSSSLIAARNKVQRDWGTYEVLADGPWYRVKRLLINPDAQSSEQRHSQRDEYWFHPDGTIREVLRGKWHKLENLSAEPLEMIEVQIGQCIEADIERL